MSGSRSATLEALPCCEEHPGAECVPWPTGGSEEHELFVEGDDLYAAMLGSISAASRRVDLETYIYAADEIGWRIGDALAERARAGVQVRVLVDAAGSLFAFSRALEGHLRRHGVVVRRFHRWSWRRALRFYRRNHRKLLVVDGREAYVGGFNLHRESSRAAYGPGRWRDTHVRMRGALAAEAAALFDAFWAGDHPWSPDAARKTGDALVPNHSRICRHPGALPVPPAAPQRRATTVSDHTVFRAGSPHSERARGGRAPECGCPPALARQERRPDHSVGGARRLLEAAVGGRAGL